MPPVDTESLDKRVSKIEWVIDQHDASIKGSAKDISDIKKALFQVKWLLWGVAIGYAAQFTGTVEFLKALLKVTVTP